jgi:flavin-binding protein dodecin
VPEGAIRAADAAVLAPATHKAHNVLPTTTKKGGNAMTVAKVIEVFSSSPESIEDAVNRGIERVEKTLDEVKGVWIKSVKCDVENGKVSRWRVDMKVTFVLKDAD